MVSWWEFSHFANYIFPSRDTFKLSWCPGNSEQHCKKNLTFYLCSSCHKNHRRLFHLSSILPSPRKKKQEMISHKKRSWRMVWKWMKSSSPQLGLWEARNGHYIHSSVSTSNMVFWPRIPFYPGCDWGHGDWAQLFSWFSRSGVCRGEFWVQGWGDSQVHSYFSFGGLCQEQLPYLYIFVFPFYSLSNPHSFVMTSYVPIYPYFSSLTTCLYVQYSAWDEFLSFSLFLIMWLITWSPCAGHMAS